MAARFQELTTYEEVKRWVDAGMQLHYRYKGWARACPVTWPIAASAWAKLKEEMAANQQHWQYGYLVEDD